MSKILRIAICLIILASVLLGCRTKNIEETQERIEPTEIIPTETKIPEKPKATDTIAEEPKPDTWMKIHKGKKLNMCEI